MPKKIRIGSNDYKVKIVRGLKDGSVKLHGQVNYNKCLIEIEEKLSVQRRQNILVHECTHALLYECGIYQDESEQHTEEFVTTVSNVLHGFLKDNIETLHDIYKKNEI